MKVDIIVRAKGEQRMTADCLASIHATAPHGRHRRILVFSYAPDDLGYFDAHLFVVSREPLGAVTATNLGLAVSLAGNPDYVLILDNDTEIPAGDTGWLDRMVAELEAYGPQCACVGAVTDRVSGQQHCLAVPDAYTGAWKDEATKREGGKAEADAPWVVSFAVLFRASVLRELGPWDTRYDPGNWEDTDYSVRVREAGYTIGVARSVYIHHRCHATFGDQIGELLRVNHQKFVEKWGLGRLWDLGFVPDRDLAISAGRRAGIVREAE